VLAAVRLHTKGACTTLCLTDLFFLCATGPEEEDEAQVMVGLAIPRVEDGALEVYESQNAGTDQYCASTLPLVEAKAWMTLALAMDAEASVAGKGCGPDQLMEACVKAAVDCEETQARQSDLKTVSLTAVQSVRVLGMPAAKNPRARGEAVTVGVVLVNPLDIPVTMAELQLVASLDRGEAADAAPAKAVDLNAFDAHLVQLRDPQAPVLGLSLVVDTQTVTLGPRQRAKVLVRVCPLESGAMVISGLKWRLQDQVWTRHALDLPGPLLHDTLEHRAAASRAPNTSLWFDVREDMPWLTAEVVHLPESLLQGQIAQASIKISNMGRAAAGTILAKSSASWFQIGAEPSVAGPDCFASPAAALLGTSGTLVQVRLPGGELSAGAHTEIPIWVRGVGGGKQTVRVVLQYSPAGSSSRAVRYVRLSCEVCVLPSLHMTASIAPWPGDPGEYLLSLLLTNFRDNGDGGAADIIVHETCSLSKAWTMEPVAVLPGNCTLEGNAMRLRCQESAVFSFRVWRHGNGPKDAAHQSCWQPGNSARAEDASSGLGPALANMCIDDMVATHKVMCSRVLSSSGAHICPR